MVSVSVVKISGKPYFYAQYRDEITGKKIRKSTKEKTRRKAERFAADWEKEIQAGTGTGISWDNFRGAS